MDDVQSRGNGDQNPRPDDIRCYGQHFATVVRAFDAMITWAGGLPPAFSA
jgi:hypothetical protein